MKRTSLLTTLVLAATATGQAEAPPPSPPGATDAAPNAYIGEVTGNNVYVRSGPGPNYYPVTKLDAGKRVRVVAREHDWLKIEPPPGTFSLIHKNFVDVEADKDAGVVNGDAVWVRAGSTLSPQLYAKQTKLDRGAVVRVTGVHNEDYLRIAPPAGAYLYISAGYVAKAPHARLDDETDSTTSAAANTPKSIQPNDGDGEASEAGGKPELEPGRYSERIAQLDAAVQTELKKPLLRRDFKPMLTGFRALVEQEQDPYARVYAKARLQQIEFAQEAVASVKRVRELGKELANERKTALVDRNRIRPPAPAIGGGFDAVGELRESMVYRSPIGPKRYRLVTTNAEGPARTIAYVDIPPDVDIDIDAALGRKVGVRARDKRLHTGDVDPIMVYLASEMVVLDQRPPSLENIDGDSGS